MKREYTLGCDPEIFVADGKYAGFHNCISAHDVGIEGTKTEPEYTATGTHLVDGMALEFTIYPVTRLDEWLQYIQNTMNELEAKIKQKNPALNFRIEPVAHFKQDYMNSLPDEVKKLGCEPDYNAYTGKMNPSPDGQVPFRTASGHIHIGWTDNEDPFSKEHYYDCCEAVKQLDAVLGVLSPLWDTDKLRQKLYGNRGAFRPKPYGVEYRVLSNKWLAKKTMQAWIYLSTIKAMELLDQGEKLYTKDFLFSYAPSYVHRYLVREYDFPVLPGHNMGLVKDRAVNPIELQHLRQNYDALQVAPATLAIKNEGVYVN